MELVYVDNGTTAALKVGADEEGHPVVVVLGKLEVVKPDENGSYDLASASASA